MKVDLCPKIVSLVGMILVLLLASFSLTTAWAGEDVAALRASAEAGDAGAQNHLGILYLFGGDGIKKDSRKAIHWFQLSATQGNSNAQYELGVLYEEGEGVAKSYPKAIHWFRLSATQGNSNAQYELGVLYEEGEGVAKSYPKAIHWHLLVWPQAGSSGMLSGNSGTLPD